MINIQHMGAQGTGKKPLSISHPQFKVLLLGIEPMMLAPTSWHATNSTPEIIQF